MRIGTGFCITLCFAAGLFAQMRSAQPVVTGTVGSVVYPGGAPGMAGVTRITGSVVNPGGGGVHLLVPGQNNRAIHAVAPRAVGVYAYPVYIGGYSDPSSYFVQPDPAASAPVQPNVTVVMAPQAPVTPVIINNFYPGASTANPGAGQQQGQRAAEDEATPAVEPAHYLFAFQDHTIYAATAYWVEGDTLHYFTSGNVHNQVSLSLVDRPFTERLNKEAGVDVTLPAPAK
jgi:hypothetical protein